MPHCHVGVGAGLAGLFCGRGRCVHCMDPTQGLSEAKVLNKVFYKGFEGPGEML